MRRALERDSCPRRAPGWPPRAAVLLSLAMATGCPALAEDDYFISIAAGAPGTGGAAGAGAARVDGGAGTAGAAGTSTTGVSGAGGELPTGGSGGEPPSGGTGGTGGEPPTGGASGVGGAAGAPASGGTGGTLALSLIDDFEDGDEDIIPLAGRQGGWFQFNDHSGTQGFSVSPGGPAASTYMLQTTGNGFSIWGAGVGADLNRYGLDSQPYDASAYQGISFWARAEVGSLQDFLVAVPDAQTFNVPGCTDCNNHFGAPFQATSEWQQFVFYWGELEQEHSSSLTAVDPSRLYVIQFQVGEGSSFDLWLDDIAFVE